MSHSGTHDIQYKIPSDTPVYDVGRSFKNKNNLPLATVLTILLYYRIDAESEVAIR